VKGYERVIAAAAGKLGLSISRTNSGALNLPIEATESDRAIITEVQPFTMTSPQRVWSLLEAVRYVETEGIPGDFAECGVWRGGSVMAMARKLVALGKDDRRIWLYDTFAGMTQPSEHDVDAASGKPAAALMADTPVGDGNNVWALASRSDVEANLRLTGYPSERFSLVAGDVAQTLKEFVPQQLALLRLDTDWYESTRVSLEILYPKLAVGGVCILDDYGHWQGAKEAVDEYFNTLGIRPLMVPIDYSGRLFIKTSRHG
jgi:O-methyltransferase